MICQEGEQDRFVSAINLRVKESTWQSKHAMRFGSYMHLTSTCSIILFPSSHFGFSAFELLDSSVSPVFLHVGVSSTKSLSTNGFP